jgi:NADPH2:quinone reductase
MSTGRRVIVRELAESPPEAIDTVFSLEPMEPPTPAPREVIVEVRSAAVGWVDLLMSSGQYQHMAKPPYTPGLESAGVVCAAGSEVSEVKIGDGVIVDGMYVGPRSLGAYQSQGGFASWVRAPAEAAIPLPSTISFDQAAGMLSSYETAYHCLITRGRLRAGETVLILGASGATGMAAVEVAKLCGATVIAVGRSDEKLAAVKAQGADHIVKSVEGGLRDAVLPLTQRGVDVVYDAVGGPLSVESLRCVKFGARFLIVGWASTPFVARGRGERGAPNANQLPTNLMMMKSLDVLGCPMAMSTAVDPSSRPPRLAQVMEWAQGEKIHPYVGRAFAIDQFREALRAKWTGEVIGGCVLHP